MLAYIFWHWPLGHIDSGNYESMLADFHRTLSLHPPAGLHGSMVIRQEGASWLPPARVTYEDWYCLDGSASLDTLNEAAVSGACLAPHTLVARAAEGGHGGLYRLRVGAGQGASLRFAGWFGKPAGMSYREIYRIIGEIDAGGGIELWERQMVLGPAPEFCLLLPEPVELPEAFAPSWLERFTVVVAAPVEPLRG